MRYSHDGTFWTSSWRQLLKSRLEYGALLSRWRPRALHQLVRRYGLPFVVWLRFRIPALSRLTGQSPAQLAICSTVGNDDKSVPVSARIAAAASCPMPGTV